MSGWLASLWSKRDICGINFNKTVLIWGTSKRGQPQITLKELSHITGLGQRTSPNVKLLCPVAKLPDRQIWETDCTQEQGTNIKWVNQPYVTELVMNTNGPMDGWSARKTNVYRTQRTSNERLTNKLGTFTGQYEHTPDNYRTCAIMCIRHTPFHSVSSLVPSSEDANNFPVNLTNVARQ